MKDIWVKFKKFSMGIFDFLNSKSGKQIKVEKYFNEETRELTFPELTGEIQALDKSGKLSVLMGKKVVKKKIVIPQTSAKEVNKFDQIQSSLLTAINGLKGEKRQEQIVKYTDALIELIKYFPDDTDVKKKVTPSGLNHNTYSDLKNFLDQRKFKSIVLPDDLTINQGFIIWPVTLLSKTTFIHKAQAQLIKLFVQNGWKLHIIIGDCGRELNWKRDFTENIKKILDPLDIEIQDNTIAFLGDYYKQEGESEKHLLDNVDSKLILTLFHQISEGLDWNKFDTLIKKNYDEKKRNEIDKRTVLNNIQPLLIWALVAAVVKRTNAKNIVIAGEDEQDQWKYITDKFTNNNLGVIYIHELQKEGKKTMNQDDLKMDSKEEMIQKLNTGNMAQWLFTHFVELPKFIHKEKPEFCKISENECDKNEMNCIQCLFEPGKNYQNDAFDKQKFVDFIWPMANPAN